MTAGRIAMVSLLGLVALLCACASSGSTPSAASADDSRDLTCDERSRVATLCLAAVSQRCASQDHDCEVRCESQESMPGTTLSATVPAIADEESARCRDQCRVSRDSCAHLTSSSCPQPCG